MAGDARCLPFTPSKKVEIPRPLPPPGAYAPSFAVDHAARPLEGGRPSYGEAGNYDDGDDDGRDLVPDDVDLVAEARSQEHILTHRFKHPKCPFCMRCKVKQTPCQQRPAR